MAKYQEYMLDHRALEPGEVLVCLDDGKLEVVYPCTTVDLNGRQDLGFNATNFKSAMWKSGNWNQELYSLSQFTLEGHYKRAAELTQRDVENIWGMHEYDVS